MIRLGRRTFLGTSIAGALSAQAGLSACKKPLTRGEVLADIVRNTAVPDVRDVLTQSRALAAALVLLEREPSSALLDEARGAWKRACLAWQRAHAFRNGPIVESNALPRASFFPPRPATIRDVIRGSDPIGPALVDKLGANGKGLFALEHLLFATPAPNVAQGWLEGDGARARAFAVALAQDVLGYAQRTNDLLGDGNAFAASFAAGGQQSLDLLVNQLLATVGEVSAHSLDLVLAMQEGGTLRLKEIRGAASGLSADIPRALLAVSQELFFGLHDDGLAALVRAVSPSMHDALSQSFQRASAAMAKITEPLEQLVIKEPGTLIEAARAVKHLDGAIKVDLMSALGVTLTFLATDGD